LTDDEWNAEFKQAFALRRTEPDQAIARLRRLSRRSTLSERRFAGGSHAAQALGMSAAILSEVGRHREAASEFKKVAKLHESALRHSGYALGSSLASAALELFQCGKADAAERAAWRALRMLGEFPDPSEIHEELMRRLRSHLNKRSGRPRRRRRAG
jgi:tetratricopeptide (TPR) repeat protein